VTGDAADIDVSDFVWEYGPEQNVEHFARHDVTPEDVLAVLRNGAIFFEGLPGRSATHVMIGRDDRGRVLFVAILAMDEPQLWKPISGWESRLARRLFNQQELTGGAP
jgi:hypothetical protein